MEIKILTESNTADTFLIPVFNDENIEKDLIKICRKYRLDQIRITDEFEGKKGEIVSSYFTKSGNTSKVVLIGLGESDFGVNQKTLKGFFTKQKKLSGEVMVDMNHLKKVHQLMLSQAFVGGSILGTYNLGLYKTEQNTRPSFKLNIQSTKHVSDIQRLITEAQHIAETQRSIMDLVNAPANKKTPQDLGNWAANSGKKYGYQVDVFDKKKITEIGLNALLAVGQGSHVPPIFIVCEYKGEGANKTVGLVGKGVTFDTGGLSIKPSSKMHYMKSDMGGAAAVLGTIEAAAKLRLPIHLIAMIPSTENSVDANSVKPGDIIHSYSGKTIEVIDTDAEGRLILADALAYMTKNYKVDTLIDFATLTGSVIRALGYHAAGIMSNNDALQSAIAQAGDSIGERVWPLPIWKDYEDALDSDVADVKNLSDLPLAGAITAAKFLEVFINDHPNWAHIDIAGTAFADSELGKQKHATGYGVRLMIEALKARF
ncbi:MAG: leucyl aminopeptidase [Cyclobacteriaceae bacterium]